MSRIHKNVGPSTYRNAWDRGSPNLFYFSPNFLKIPPLDKREIPIYSGVHREYRGVSSNNCVEKQKRKYLLRKTELKAIFALLHGCSTCLKGIHPSYISVESLYKEFSK